MLEIHNRNLKSVNGVLNMMTHLFGVDRMCRMKRVLGKIYGGKTKKERFRALDEWSQSGIPNTGCSANVDGRAWARAFTRLLQQSNDNLHLEMVKEFYHCDLKMIKDFAGKGSAGGPVLLCVERNEILRIRQFLEHYRKLGIKRFLITDNRSTDGTKEYLQEQPDVRLYDTARQFSSRSKSAWQNRMMADYGLNHWCVYVDADEFLWYPEAADMNLPDYAAALERRGIHAVKGIMLDMYPKGIIGAQEYDGRDFIEEYCYFDGDGDIYQYDPDMNIVSGGVLARLFPGSYLLRTKIPMYYHTEHRFQVGAHHISPLNEDIASPFSMLLRHYKFLPGDEEKVREAIRKQNYANHSLLYRKYVSFYDGESISAYNSDSRKWCDGSCSEFPIIKRLAEEA